MGKFVCIHVLASIIATLLYAGFYKTHTHEKKNNYLLKSILSDDGTIFFEK